MSLKFTPEDFSVGQLIGCEYAADKAQFKFDSWLAEQQQVWGDGEEYWNDQNDPDMEHSHTARLVCIEAIEKKPCNHEPNYDDERARDTCSFKCVRCGVKLKAKWEEVE